MKTKLTLNNVKSLQPQAEVMKVWDTAVIGFGLKITPAGRKVYILKYRFGNRQRWYTIGTHGSPWTPETARSEAIKLLGIVRAGSDPATMRNSHSSRMTISELCDLYLKEGCPTKKPTTLYSDISRIERHIKPLIGKLDVKTLSASDIRNFMQDVANGKTAINVKNDKPKSRSIVKGGKGIATRTVGLLGGILTYAVELGIRENNPVWGVKKYEYNVNQRYLSEDEIVTLGNTIQKLEDEEKESIFALNALRLYILTGARKSEILNAKWADVDFDNAFIRLHTSKTNQQFIHLGSAAIELLQKMPRRQGSPYLVPGLTNEKQLVGLQRVWVRVRKVAGLEDVRLHDLRHTFASFAVNRNVSLYLIGKILRHKDVKTTQRYAHLSDSPVKMAMNDTSHRIAGIMN